MEINTKNVRIGDVLKEYGYVNDEQIEQALVYQKANKGVRLGEALIATEAITEKQMLEALAQRLGLQLVDISNQKVDIEAIEQIPQQLAQKYLMLAIAMEEGLLTVVVNDPLNFYAMEDIRQVTGMQLHVMLSERAPLENAIKYYYSEVSAKLAAKKANVSTQDDASASLEEVAFDEDGDNEVPIINLLNSLLKRAYSTNTSDIHIEPHESNTVVRMRIDGVLVDYVTLQKNLHASLIARIKIMSDLDIAERRVPQDGHFRMKIDDEFINMRVSVIPTVFGEKAVIRLLASVAAIDHGSSFGMNAQDYEKFHRMLQSPNGIIYVTGPTGSGKSTTLYMVLEEMSKRAVNISTIEDPVEKNLLKLNQMQVNNMAGLTFEVGLRALLRQDPDIIMVGETRDSETANISVRAAITGHLVFSTLHTNDSVSSIIRLVDMGLEPYMVANSLVGIVAQRLMRKTCTHCAEDVNLSLQQQEYVGHRFMTQKKGKGCNYCNYTGYSGRTAIHELFYVDKTIRQMISNGSTMEDIQDYCVKEQGMLTLKETGTRLVEQGVTTMDELMKVAYYE